MIAAVAPDILVLQGIDYDAGGATLSVLADRIAEDGPDYPHRFALRPNTGMATGLDMNGDGDLGDPRDAQGYGRFAGADGLAILSRFEILAEDAVDLSGLLWRDLPGAIPPMIEGRAFPSEEAAAIQRLSSTAHWIVPVEIDGTPLTLLTWRATPPVFDGPEDLNGRRNHDEAALWLRLVDGDLYTPPPPTPFVILGNANLDPEDGDGRRAAMDTLLSDPRLRDIAPRSAGGAAAADPGHTGDPALDTADFDDPPGNLRVDYLIPSADLAVRGAGVYWPAPGTPEAEALGPVEDWPRHRIVWADLDLE
ncbi:endonuclease/exonuclease/phosphatase family protein [Palleronia aestuarii]|uniref:Endonuclease/exonuclease/phosphatase family protein n=1 Tax=Palleronia aestuarii TaxID=568105 RepID=A0A2W7NG03_9RHOB|nr:endonuclease/exonuclease/phosphatase family protein [Palleronia aestuarii]PZX17107.1 endonuclease/exonuclease/phosphatase family protein [Palleronia aestuarii]